MVPEVPPPPVVRLELETIALGELLPLPHIVILMSSDVAVNGFEIHYKFLPNDLPTSDIIVLDGDILEVSMRRVLLS